MRKTKCYVCGPATKCRHAVGIPLKGVAASRRLTDKEARRVTVAWTPEMFTSASKLLGKGPAPLPRSIGWWPVADGDALCGVRRNRRRRASGEEAA